MKYPTQNRSVTTASGVEHVSPQSVDITYLKTENHLLVFEVYNSKYECNDLALVATIEMEIKVML